MAAFYNTPGVYVEEITTFPPSIAPVETAIPAFVGYTQKAIRNGETLIQKPTRIESIAEYEELFGYAPSQNVEVVLNNDNNFVRSQAVSALYLYDSLRMFYANGGGRCYIISVGLYPNSNLGILASDIEEGLANLALEDDPTIIVMPDAVSIDGAGPYTLQQTALAQCATLKDRVTLCDLVKTTDFTAFNEEVARFRTAIGINSLKYGAAYAPWINANLPRQIWRRNLVLKRDVTGEEIQLESLTADPNILSVIQDIKRVEADSADLTNSITTITGAPDKTLNDSLQKALDAYRLTSDVSTVAQLTTALEGFTDITFAILKAVQTLNAKPDVADTKYEIKKTITSYLNSSGLKNSIAVLVAHHTLQGANATALSAADTAATKAKTDADKAKTDADKAKTKADKAKTDADKAKVDADKAKVDADKAKVDADKAKADADADPADANLAAEAKAKADAKVVADKAKVDADKAKADADKAYADADKARVDADKTKVDADKAKVDADAYLAAVKISAAAPIAKIIQTGATLDEAAKLLDFTDGAALLADTSQKAAVTAQYSSAVDTLKKRADISRNAAYAALTDALQLFLSVQDSLIDFEKSFNDTLMTAFGKFKELINKGAEALNLLPPSGAIAGVYAQTDNERGVWKAPANVSLNAVFSPAVKISQLQQGEYNVDVKAGKSINIIRAFPGKGTLVWGGRTLAGNDNEWRYVQVRRFFNFVEESVKKATEQFVFDANDANTWVRVQAMIDNFLNTLWRQGALQGVKPEHGYYVVVGLGKTMTQLDITEGRMIIKIGMAALRPAEFIILKFSHKMVES